jgi:DNA-binding response OmpR family regulator
VVSRSRHVLVVDQDAATRELVVSILEERGYCVSCAEGGPIMRRILADDAVDAIVMDASLPGEASDSLAERAKMLRLPVVMISGSDAIMGYSADHDLQLLHKPFRIRELCDALDQAFASGAFGRRRI